VRWYLRYGLSYRDLEELLAERGIEVDHVTLHRWVQRFTPLLIDAARPVRHLAGDRWFVDETYVKVAGVWRYVYRAVDQHGQVIDVYVSQCRIAPARMFFTAALKRRLSDIVFQQMLNDAMKHQATGPGGQTGNDSDSSATGSHPSVSSSDKPLPGPVANQPKTTLPTAS